MPFFSATSYVRNNDKGQHKSRIDVAFPSSTPTHQRLDMWLNDDGCHVRSTNGWWILGMLRRMAISLYTHWRAGQPKFCSLWFTDFQAAMGEDDLAKAVAFVSSRRPKFI
jgi:hypothetical protein